MNISISDFQKSKVSVNSLGFPNQHIYAMYYIKYTELTNNFEGLNNYTSLFNPNRGFFPS